MRTNVQIGFYNISKILQISVSLLYFSKRKPELFFFKKISGISQKYRGNGLLVIRHKNRFIFKLKNSVLSRLQGKYIKKNHIVNITKCNKNFKEKLSCNCPGT